MQQLVMIVYSKLVSTISIDPRDHRLLTPAAPNAFSQLAKVVQPGELFLLSSFSQDSLSHVCEYILVSFYPTCTVWL
jgi:hypothetical protein